MPDSFASEWYRERKTPLRQAISDTMHPVPLRERINQTRYRLTVVSRRLEDSKARIDQKQKELFQKCVHAQELKDQTTAIMYANECSQVRKMAATILSAKYAIEQVILRLETVTDFGDVASVIMPAARIVNTLKGRLAGVVPEVSMQLASIGTTLDSIVLEAGEATGTTFSSLVQGEEAEKILAEATAIADQKLREGFPPLPTAEAAEKGPSTTQR
ncbi:MAG: Snf7 family protein [Candidatus Bathyarchaeia archaeon]